MAKVYILVQLLPNMFLVPTSVHFSSTIAKYVFTPNYVICIHFFNSLSVLVLRVNCYFNVTFTVPRQMH